MKLSYRFWFETDKGYVFGPGAYQLLKEVQKTKSLRKAAENLGMSYRHAWGMIKEIEEHTGYKIIESFRGGRGGGESHLTDKGNELIREFEKYDELFKYIVKHPYKKPSITVDGILVEEGKILLIQRKKDPFKGFYALPGGFVEYGERTEEAMIREMREETGLEVEIKNLIGVYSDPNRDPRGHTITVVYELQRKGGKLRGGDDASSTIMLPLEELPLLAFDHNKIVEDYKKFSRQ